MSIRNKLYSGVLYVGLAAASLLGAAGCGGSKGIDAAEFGKKLDYGFENSKTEQAFNNVVYNMRQHGRLDKPGKLSAILLRAAEHDGDVTNPLTTDDLRFIIESEIEQNNNLYGWKKDEKEDK